MAEMIVGRITSTGLNEVDLTSQIDGIKDTFTVPEQYVSGTLRVHINGQRGRKGSSVGDPNTFFEIDDTTFKVYRILRQLINSRGDDLVIEYVPA